MNKLLIEINFILPDTIEKELLKPKNDILVARKKNLTGGEVIIQILIGVISTISADLLNRFIIDKLKNNKTARVQVNDISITNNHDEIHIHLNEKVIKSNEGKKNRRIPKVKKGKKAGR